MFLEFSALKPLMGYILELSSTPSYDVDMMSNFMKHSTWSLWRGSIVSPNVYTYEKADHDDATQE